MQNVVLENLVYKGTLRQVFICLGLRTPTQERGLGGKLNQREEVRGATVHKAGSKILTRLTVSPILQFIYSDKHMPQSPFTDQYFEMTTFCLIAYKVN
jgi:hypothetical protein